MPSLSNSPRGWSQKRFSFRGIISAFISKHSEVSVEQSTLWFELISVQMQFPDSSCARTTHLLVAQVPLFCTDEATAGIKPSKTSDRGSILQVKSMDKVLSDSRQYLKRLPSHTQILGKSTSCTFICYFSESGTNACLQMPVIPLTWWGNNREETKANLKPIPWASLMD